MIESTRRVVGNVSLSLDGRMNGPGGPYDMGWIVRHAVTPAARAHLLRVSATATTVLLGRRNYEGFAGYWPAVADDEAADPSDRAFSWWLNEVDKVVFSTTLIDSPWHAHAAHRRSADHRRQAVARAGRRRRRRTGQRHRHPCAAGGR